MMCLVDNDQSELARVKSVQPSRILKRLIGSDDTALVQLVASEEEFVLT